ncbi:helix-turn-helix domain-containing protein [Nakamurella sp. YIM 132087]|uniref:Helix-turn-helix domain-containing protein n=1 Tax=Nakamurella alba TaxID=2665158 RepID=A0A7K1FMD7_9ACTN|nr:helix-turn-helix domain-containing protein [Nakamurella alba]MTD15276.1 helix-turn-helix domain-containing protein [Nakamurella alba]
MDEVAVIEDPAAAEVVLDPVRAGLLAALVSPGSASTLAASVGLSRQKVNYHLHALERVGLIELVEERRKGNMTERVLKAVAASFVISPAALLPVAPDPARSRDEYSAGWLLALSARLVREVGTLVAGARAAGQPLATFAGDTRIDFASAADRAAFARELAASVDELVDRYHRPQAPGARGHRLVLAMHPTLRETGDGAAVSGPKAVRTSAPPT